jgi:hypothetical protein
MPKESNSMDKEFLDLVNKYIPKETTPEQIAYAEASTKNTKDMITFWENIMNNTKDMDEEGKAYCQRVIDGYERELKKQEEGKEKIFTPEQIVSMLTELSKTKEFDRLPIPIAYLEAMAEKDDSAKDELARIKFMDKQVKTTDEKTRLENYKDYLLDKIDRRKLDKKLKSNPNYGK